MTGCRVPAIGSIAPVGRKRAVCGYTATRHVALVETLQLSENDISFLKAGKQVLKPRCRLIFGTLPGH